MCLYHGGKIDSSSGLIRRKDFLNGFNVPVFILPFDNVRDCSTASSCNEDGMDWKQVRRLAPALRANKNFCKAGAP